MLKADFSHLTPKGTVRYTLNGVQVNSQSAPSTTLIMKHAGRSNAAFVNAIMKQTEGAGGARTAQALDAHDGRSIEVFAKTVVVGWEGPCEEDGKPAQCTPENVKIVLDALLEAKCHDIVNGALRFAENADNFRASTSPEVLGKE